ncbi:MULTISPECIES: DUF29 domain-containing protein [Pseudanabaena]|uniref:DUF29 domain-containing protein n=2 Tax=Pseudanabaena TaxID=1152 RepID=L8N2Q7_9CYAN|nr:MULTISPECIES: DUF29 domain-containing protein [Pseudanabaena]ELS33981.1 protein of unknown function DUF29 [Pseudanabaena biceps PCC 7429]MDG3493827.1 DUF29 domain-containing protein [Pseudanabaena catenata USMAC16]
MTQAYLETQDIHESAIANNSLDSLTALYECDFNLWVEATAQLLREGRLADLDVGNLIEEVESMGNSDKHALSSDLVVVLLHLLKWQYQPNKRTRSWEKSIAEHRRRIRKIFKSSPSLRNYFQQIFDECYLDARKQAKIETRLLLEHFPVNSPFTSQQVLDEDFLPE